MHRPARLTLAATILGLAAMAFSQPGGAGAAHPATPVDWPHFRFDNNHTGYQPHERTLGKSTIQSAQLLWHDFLGGELVDMSSAAVVNGIAYIGEFDGSFTAYAAGGCGSDDCQKPI